MFFFPFGFLLFFISTQSSTSFLLSIKHTYDVKLSWLQHKVCWVCGSLIAFSCLSGVQALRWDRTRRLHCLRSPWRQTGDHCRRDRSEQGTSCCIFTHHLLRMKLSHVWVRCLYPECWSIRLYNCVLSCVCVAGAGRRTLHRREEAVDALQVHAAHRLRHQSSSWVRHHLYSPPARNSWHLFNIKVKAALNFYPVKSRGQSDEWQDWRLLSCHQITGKPAAAPW